MNPTLQPRPPKPGTKLADLVAALNGKGSTIPKLSNRLGWQPHTIRAAMTRLRQRGYVITRSKADKSAVSIFKISKS
ncbi:MAG: DUF3489 domain-containing protein [Pseudomonadota bacterium]